MERHELNRMFDALASAPGREEELLDGLLQDVKRRKNSMKSWKQVAVGLAAAVLLVGTATAAHYVGVSLVDNRENNGFLEFAGGMAYYPAEQLSDEVKEFEAAYTGDGAPKKTFSSWEEMESFLGVDLMDSPLLDAFPAQRFYKVIDDGEQRVAGKFILTVYQGLTQFIADGCYEIGGCDINVQAYLFTDKGEDARSLDDMFYGIKFRDAEVNWENAATPGGRQIQVVDVERGEGRNKTCMGAVSLNGIPVIVKVNSKEGVAEARQVLMEVLDSFQ